MTTIRISVDFNERDQEGHLVTLLHLADGPVDAGDQVLAVDPFDRILANATAAGVDRERRTARLAVDWHSFRDDPEATEDPSCE